MGCLPLFCGVGATEEDKTIESSWAKTQLCYHDLVIAPSFRTQALPSVLLALL